MKSTELMHGDWVSVRDKDGARKAYRAHSDVTLDEGYTEINPIPMGRDLLESNGWKPLNELPFTLTGADTYLYTLNHKDSYLEARLDKRTLAVWLNYVEGYGCYSDYLLPFPRFVHEFQHAFRLCGLDELADNFKI